MSRFAGSTANRIRARQTSPRRMLILVANLGSTSLQVQAPGHGAGRRGDRARRRTSGSARPGSPYQTHGDVIDVDPQRAAAARPDAIGFKAVHGGPISGAVRVTDEVIATMEQFADVAPAHNPPYIAAMRAFRQKLPDVPQVAAFETAFHQTIPLAAAGLRDPARVDRKARHPPVRLPRRQPPLHRDARAGAGRPGAVPADHQLPPRRELLDLRDRGRQESSPTASA